MLSFLSPPAAAATNWWPDVYWLDLPMPGLITVAVLLIISLGVHEAAHAWVALRCGDPTGRDMGRITLNPIPHIDPFMSIFLPALLIMSGSGILFGGAKPVPVNFHRLRRPYRDMALVALAGPVSNFLIGMLFFGLVHGLQQFSYWDGKLLLPILQWAGLWNLLLAAFNLLPIPPLDGSRVMTWLLPTSLRAGYVQLERFGLLIVVGLFILAPGLLQGPMWATIDAQMWVIKRVVTLGGLW